MKTDRIFVLLLIVMLPMSGCFGDGVGDAEAADYNDEGTTVIHYNNTTIVNNYYNNTTTNPLPHSVETFVVGGTDIYSGLTHFENIYSINTTSGQKLTLDTLQSYGHLINVSGTAFDTANHHWFGSLHAWTNCSQGAHFVSIGGLMPGAFDNCTHEIAISPSQMLNQELEQYPDIDKRAAYSWSLTYHIENVTVA